MPDRLIVAEIPVEGLAEGGDVHADHAIDEQLNFAGFDFAKNGSMIVVNEKPGEDDPSTGYVVTHVEVPTQPATGVHSDSATLHDLFVCSCPAYKYQLPSADQLRDGVVGVEGIGDCKHSKAVKRVKRVENTDENQSTLADELGIDVDDGQTNDESELHRRR